MILIDDRAGSRELVPLLPPELCKQIRLEAGDAAWFGHGPEGPCTFPIGLEYKTVTETIQVITSKRFVGEQYPKMAPLYKRIYFLIEGEYKEGSDGRLLVPGWDKGKPTWTHHGWSMTFRQFDNWQNSIAETGRVVFKRSMDRMQSAAMVYDLYCMWTKEYDQHKSLFAFDKSQLPPTIEQPTLLRLIAAQIPNIGWQRSKAVAATFQTPYHMVNADEAAWQQVNGIGKTIAHKVWKLLRT